MIRVALLSFLNAALYECDIPMMLSALVIRHLAS